MRPPLSPMRRWNTFPRRVLNPLMNPGGAAFRPTLASGCTPWSRGINTMRAVHFFRRRLSALVALALIGVLHALAQQPALPPAEAVQLASRFRFTRLPLPELPGLTPKLVRQVHPSLKHISAWISSVGAAVAIADLDGDGLPNDLCHVDPRTDIVLVAPVPGTPARYQPFVLDPTP